MVQATTVTKATLNNQSWINLQSVLQLYITDTNKTNRDASKWIKGSFPDIRQRAHSGWPIIVIGDPAEDTTELPIDRANENILLTFPITVYSKDNSDLKKLVDDIRNILKTHETDFEGWGMHNLSVDMGDSTTAEFGEKIILIKEVTVTFEFAG